MSDAYDVMSAMMDWENGELDEEGEDELFQFLVDNGMAWSLQGMYGRNAMRLLRAGRIQPKGD